MQDYQERIQMDRYAIKNPDAQPKVGDTVVVALKRKFQQDGEVIESREVGIVTRVWISSGGAETEYSVTLRDRAKSQDSWEVVEHLSRNQLDVLVETSYADICRRVANGIIKMEPDNHSFRDDVYNAMVSEEFVPAGRILSGVGRDDLHLTLFNCYVFPPPHDSRTGITKTWGLLFDTFSVGGGVGLHGSTLRPRGAVVRKVNGRSSGVVSWMEQYSQVAGTVEQGGSRRGAILLGLWIWHPDVIELVEAKSQRASFTLEDGREVSRNRELLSNANISILVSDKFMEAVKGDAMWDLVFPDMEDPDYDTGWTGDLDEWLAAGRKVIMYKRVKAKWLWDLIIKKAWESGEPGLIFMDRANKMSNSWYYSRLSCGNPCAEQLLPNFGICNLGHLHLAKFIRSDAEQLPECEIDSETAIKQVDWDRFKRVISIAVRFLDNITELNRYHLAETEQQQRKERRIGIGILGYAELLVRLGLRYGSPEAEKFTHYLFRKFSKYSYLASVDLAKERGAFPAFDAEKFLASGFMRIHDAEVIEAVRQHGIRNCTLNTAAPTGSVGTMLNTTTGIEPYFLAEWEARSRIGAASEEANVLSELKRKFGRVQPPYFATTATVTPEEHVRTQAAVQRWIDASISKCIALGTLIPTDKGLILVEAFAGAHEIDTFVPTDGDFRTNGHRIISHYRAGQKAATRIRLDNGAELVGATESHRVLTPNGLRRLSELKPGDIIVGRFQESHGKGGMHLSWTGNMRTNANEVKTPEYMTPAFAQFLGMLAADGHTTEVTGQVGLTCKNDHVAATFRKLCREIFGITPKKHTDARNGVLCIYLTSRNLVRFVESLISKGAYNKHAPMAVLQGNYEEKLAFLAGVSLDGYATPQGLVIYDGMSKDLAYHVAEIARSFGLPMVNQGNKWVAASKAYTYSVTVSNEMQELVTPIELHKRKTAIYKRFKVLADVHKMARSAFYSRSTQYYALRAAQYRNQSYLFNTTAKTLGISADIPVYRVTKVEDVGIVEMYDVEVEDAHEYVVNGMVSHNTVNLPNSATVEDVSKVYAMLYDMGCKGGTIYRDRSRDRQVLYHKGSEPKIPVEIVDEYMKGSTDVSPDAEVIRPRIKAGLSVTLSQKTPTGWVHGTIRMHPQTGEPYDLFLSSGKGDIAADVQALGRLISVILRWPNHTYIGQSTRLEIIRNQLFRIPGGQQEGYGPTATISMPDGVAQLLHQYLAGAFPLAMIPLGVRPMEQYIEEVDPDADPREVLRQLLNQPSLKEDGPMAVDDAPDFIETLVDVSQQSSQPMEQCPECKQISLLRQIGHCPHCVVCGLKLC